MEGRGHQYTWYLKLCELLRSVRENVDRGLRIRPLVYSKILLKLPENKRRYEKRTDFTLSPKEEARGVGQLFPDIRGRPEGAVGGGGEVRG